MQDRFKFRVWEKADRTMLYPTKEDEGIELDANGELVGTDLEDVYVGGGNCVLMQCTGLRDKNDKLIYEHDIVKCKFDTEEVLGVVNWATDGLIGWYLNTTDYFGARYVTDYDLASNYCYEVIGNIYTDPELLV